MATDSKDEQPSSAGSYIAAAGLGAAAGAVATAKGVELHYKNPMNILRDSAGKAVHGVGDKKNVQKILERGAQHLGSLVGAPESMSAQDVFKGFVTRLREQLSDERYVSRVLDNLQEKFGEGVAAHVEDVMHTIKPALEHDTPEQMAAAISEAAKPFLESSIIKKIKPTFIGRVPGGPKTVVATGALASGIAAVTILHGLFEHIHAGQAQASHTAQVEAERNNRGPNQVG